MSLRARRACLHAEVPHPYIWQVKVSARRRGNLIVLLEIASSSRRSGAPRNDALGANANDHVLLVINLQLNLFDQRSLDIPEEYDIFDRPLYGIKLFR